MLLAESPTECTALVRNRRRFAPFVGPATKRIRRDRGRYREGYAVGAAGPVGSLGAGCRRPVQDGLGGCHQHCRALQAADQLGVAVDDQVVATVLERRPHQRHDRPRLHVGRPTGGRRRPAADALPVGDDRDGVGASVIATVSSNGVRPNCSTASRSRSTDTGTLTVVRLAGRVAERPVNVGQRPVSGPPARLISRRALPAGPPRRGFLRAVQPGGGERSGHGHPRPGDARAAARRRSSWPRRPSSSSTGATRSPARSRAPSTPPSSRPSTARTSTPWPRASTRPSTT